ncbi:hypothetical protein Tco_0200070, partial [Tanacetum coccineum]
ALDRITLRELIGPNGKLITEAPMLGAPRVSMLVPLRPSMQDLYDRMGNIEIRQGVGAYNPPGYDQKQYQQYQQ